MTTENMTTRLPPKGIPSAELIRDIAEMQKQDVAWQEGKTWSLVYYAGKEHDRLLKDAYEKYFSANYLNPMAFAGLQRMEKEVVRMTAELLQGDDHVVGTMSSGGTESILLALYTYREWARQHHPHIGKPEIVAPQTIHPAHDKAAHLFGIELRKVPTGQNQMADCAGMERLINKNTILLAASAPSYANGVLDPIADIGKLAQKHKLPFHVDACIGGFMLPWIEKLGAELPLWDFRVPGVTSISADVHKFGFGAKGASVILYRSLEFLKHQFFITTDFPGGIYITSTLLGTRPGGPIAAAWAGMKHMGMQGYLDLARELMDGKNRLQTAFERIPEIYVIGDPCMNIISYSTHHNKPDIFAIADYLENKGWMVDRQQFPDCIHLTILPTNVKIIDNYTVDLNEAIEYAREHPGTTGEGNAALYGMMARIPFRGVVEKNVRHILETMYGGDTKEVEDKSDHEVMVKTPGWMGLLSRFLAWWYRIFSRD